MNRQINKEIESRVVAEVRALEATNEVLAVEADNKVTVGDNRVGNIVVEDKGKGT